MPKRFFEGYHAVEYEVLNNMNKDQLLDQLDALQGRDRLPVGFSDDQLKAEALRQVRLDWLNPDHEHYQEERNRLDTQHI